MACHGRCQARWSQYYTKFVVDQHQMNQHENFKQYSNLMIAPLVVILIPNYTLQAFSLRVTLIMYSEGLMKTVIPGIYHCLCSSLYGWP